MSTEKLKRLSQIICETCSAPTRYKPCLHCEVSRILNELLSEVESMTSKNVTISQTLQQNWALTNPALAEILWQTTRADTLAFQATNKKYVISCYNPTGAMQNEPLSREAWMQSERVIVDLIIKVASTTAAASDVRENMRNEVYRILHSQEHMIPGIAEAYVEREITKVESVELVRLTLQLVCKTFHLTG